MRIYVAGPYSKGDVAENVRAAILAADEVSALHHLPYVPHLTHFWHLVSPKPYRWWLEYDALWLLQCEAVLRLPGESAGADEEVRMAQLADMPVFYSLEELEHYSSPEARAERGECVFCHTTRKRCEEQAPGKCCVACRIACLHEEGAHP